MPSLPDPISGMHAPQQEEPDLAPLRLGRGSSRGDPSGLSARSTDTDGAWGSGALSAQGSGVPRTASFGRASGGGDGAGNAGGLAAQHSGVPRAASFGRASGGGDGAAGNAGSLTARSTASSATAFYDAAEELDNDDDEVSSPPIAGAPPLAS